jgi:hypothetical protein
MICDRRENIDYREYMLVNLGGCSIIRFLCCHSLTFQETLTTHAGNCSLRAATFVFYLRVASKKRWQHMLVTADYEQQYFLLESGFQETLTTQAGNCLLRAAICLLLESGFQETLTTHAGNCLLRAAIFLFYLRVATKKR